MLVLNIGLLDLLCYWVIRLEVSPFFVAMHSRFVCRVIKLWRLQLGRRLRAYVGLQDAMDPIPIERHLSYLLNIILS